jgi:metallo-beta-lactamase class B
VRALAAVTVLGLAVGAFGQRKFEQNDWIKPFPAHRIIGPVYYVGTTDLACFLITSSKGHILINTGLADSTTQIRKNIESLGFKPTDVKILLTNQAHFDHVAAMAEMKKQTGAEVMATEGDKPALEDGGRSDFFLGEEYRFAPVKVDAVLTDGQVIQIGDLRLNTHVTPGHTRGSVTYSMRVRENGRDYNVVFANIGSVIGAKLLNNAKYPSIAKDFERSYRVQRALACDVFLAAHGSQYRMTLKYKPAYSPDAFVDPEGYKSAIAQAENKFKEQLEKEQAKVR